MPNTKTLTTISLDKTKRPKVKQVIEGYGLNLNKLHQLLEDYIYQTGELPLFLLKPQTGQIYDATSDFQDFTPKKLDELIQKPQEKEVVFMELPKYEQIIPLEANADPYNYDYKLKANAGTDDEAPISLSFSQRLRLNLDSV